MIDHCISAFLKRQDEKIYRIYVTDALKAMVENTSRFAGGTVIKTRYCDLVDRTPKKETESAEQIVDRIRNGLKSI